MSECRTAGVSLDLRGQCRDGEIPCVLATDAGVDRGGYKEILDHSKEAIDLTRAAQGLALLLHHDPARPIGRVESIRSDGHKLRGIARFSSADEAQQARADVEAGILPSLSVGYQVLATAEEPGGVVRVTRWAPHEVSLVAIPADLNAGMYRSQQLEGKEKMNTAIRAEIEALARRHALPGKTLEQLINDNATIDQARSACLDHLAQRDAGGTAGRLPLDENQNLSPVAGALDARFGIRGAKGDARSLVEIAANCLESAGVRNVRSMSRNEIATRALSTSDFPSLLAGAAGKALVQAYENTPSVLKAVSREVTLPDFKSRTVIRLGAAPDLAPVNELGEFTYGKADEASAAYKLLTYGKIISLSRQAIVNDDLGAFADLTMKFGQAASRKEGDLLADLILSNPTVDGLAMFHATRNTLLTGVNSSLTSGAGIETAVKFLRLQKEIGGGFIQQSPAFLIVPAALENIARKAVFSISPVVTSEANPIAQTLQVIVEPRLDAASATAWYLAASSGSNSLEHAYLEGQQGVYIETRNGFEVDGLEIKARLDFGCGFVAPTGWIKNAGV